MSNIKKKRRSPTDSGIEEDIVFEKIIKFTGWIFLVLIIGFLGVWLIFDSALDLIEIVLEAPVFAIIIFLGINSAISFGLSSVIKSNRDLKNKYYYDWLIGELLICLFAIFSVAAYQW
jgi:magnesium-transporting ATPase (P-type)